MGVKCLAQEHNAVPRPGLEPGPFNPESSALTTRPPHQVQWISLNHSMTLDRYEFKVKLGGERCVKMCQDVKTLDFASFMAC